MAKEYNNRPPCDYDLGLCQMAGEDVLERIAERAAEKAIEKLTAQIYQEIGKGIVKKLFYVTGAIAVGVFFWLKSGGFIK